MHKVCYVLLLSALVTQHVFANEFTSEWNDVSENQDGSFSVSGQDPYWILPLQDKTSSAEDASASRHLLIELLPNSQDKVDTLAIEVFFKELETADGQQYDPRFRLKFSVNAKELVDKQGRLAMLVPSGVSLEQAKSLRLDIDGCALCRLELKSAAKLVSTTTETVVLTPQRVFNGARMISTGTLELDIEQWTTHDIEKISNKLKIVGEDPFLVSPILDIDTQSLGGVLIKLRLPESLERASYQLFYATDKHRFVEAASSFIQAESNKGTSEFLIPLDFLSKEQPSAQILQRLRLDLDTQADQAWLIDSISLVDKPQLENLQHLVPARLLQRKIQRAKGLSLIKKVISKITGDLGFTLGYLALLFFVSMMFIRAYRK